MTEDKPYLIIGGGLAGVITVLRRARGLPAVLLDAADAPAQGASHANGAVLHPSLPDPWNSPGIAAPLLASLFDPNAAMKLHLRQIPNLFGWGLDFLRHAALQRHRAVTRANYALAQYSTRQTDALRQLLNLQFEDSAPGTLKLFRNAAEKSAALALADMLAEQGLTYELLDRPALLAREPQLQHAVSPIEGALHFPDDRVGNARLFCDRLVAEATAQGGVWRGGAKVDRLLVDKGRVVGVALGAEHLYGEVVLCAGADAPVLAKQAGVHLPIQPAKGYSLTVPLDGVQDAAVTHPIVDPQLHIVLTPLPGRIRLLGMAEFIGFDRRIAPRRIALLRGFFEKLMPQLADRLDWQAAEPWAGLRPMSSDGRPFIGAAGPEGLWV